MAWKAAQVRSQACQVGSRMACGTGPSDLQRRCSCNGMLLRRAEATVPLGLCTSHVLVIASLPWPRKVNVPDIPQNM